MGKKLNADSNAVENVLALYTFFLMNKGPFSLTELSHRFGVSKPTMGRYLIQLEKSHYGKICREERGRKHYYTLERPHPLPKIALEPQGLQMLALCRTFMAHILPTSMQRHIDHVLQSATAYVPPHNAGQALDALNVSVSGHSVSKGRINYEPFGDMLKLLIRAMTERLVCTVSYKKTRTSEPYSFDYAPQKLISYNDAIYIRGWKVTDKGTVETLHEGGTDLVLHRFQDVFLTRRECGHLPPVPESKEETFGYMQHEPFTVKLQFTEKPATYIAERIWSHGQIVEDMPDGGIMLTMRASNEFEIVPWVLGFGAQVRVLEPEWLREKVVEVGREVCGVYGDGNADI